MMHVTQNIYMLYLICEYYNDYGIKSNSSHFIQRLTTKIISGVFSVPTNGHFLTTDPYFSIEKFIPPYFKKNIGKKLKKSTKAASEDKELEPMANWMEQIKRVDIASYQSNDPQYYEQVINEVYDLFAAEKVDPLISQTYKLAGINKATDFITRRKCLGNVLINVSE